MVFNGPAIREFRRRMGLTQVELAKRIGVTQGHLANVEAGRHTLSEANARLVAQEFGFTDLRPIMGDVGRDVIPV